MAEVDEQNVALQVVNDRLIGTLGSDVSLESLRNFRAEILNAVKEYSVRQVIIDVSGISILDSHDFDEIVKTIEMVEILGAKSVLVGLNPGIITSLVYLDVPVDKVTTALNLKLAIKLLDQQV